MIGDHIGFAVCGFDSVRECGEYLSKTAARYRSKGLTVTLNGGHLITPSIDAQCGDAMTREELAAAGRLSTGQMERSIARMRLYAWVDALPPAEQAVFYGAEPTAPMLVMLGKDNWEYWMLGMCYDAVYKDPSFLRAEGNMNRTATKGEHRALFAWTLQQFPACSRHQERVLTQWDRVYSGRSGTPSGR